MTIDRRYKLINALIKSTDLDPAIFANPTALLGLAAVNGSASTVMRSDAAPALNQAIAPTWTGNHIFTPASGVGVVMNGLATLQALTVAANATGNGIYLSTLLSAGLVLNSSGSDFCKLQNDGANLWSIATNNAFGGLGTPVFQWKNAGASGLSGRGPVAAALVDMTPDVGSYTATLTGCTTAPTVTIVWARVGNLVFAWVPAVTATSNSTACSLTGSMPASIQPAGHAQNIAMLTVNNSVAAFGGAQVNVGSSTISLLTTTAAGYSATFTNANSKGTGGGVLHWLLN